jgi:hypothetical protein
MLLRTYLAELGQPPTPHFAAETAGTVVAMLLLMAVETAALYAILRPWTYRRSVERSLTGLAIFVPWTMLSLFGAMHARSSFLVHWMWLLLVVTVLFVCAVVSAVARRAQRTAG